LREDYGASASELPEEDYDFQFLYAISKDFSGDDYEWWPIPFPLEVYPLDDKDSGGIDPLRCTMAFFDPYDGGSTQLEEAGSLAAVSISAGPGTLTALSPVFGPVRSIVFGAAEGILQGHFNFPIQPQPPQSNLCWAAAASSVDDHFREQEHWEQCKFASSALGEDCCSAYPGSCDQSWFTWLALESRGCFERPVEPSAAAFQKIVTEVTQKQPICASTGGHVVIVHGWLIEEDGREQFEYSDPMGANRTFMRYRKKPKIGSERWTRTYFTRKPS
jgi:hypothetical protein